MWWVIQDFFEFIVWPPIRKLGVWYDKHLQRKQKWWHP